jgi:hypothetical protein
MGLFLIFVIAAMIDLFAFMGWVYLLSYLIEIV